MTKDLHVDFETILSNFDLGGQWVGCLPYGSGHINDTYAAYYQMEDGTARRYIMQRINTHVFKDPDGLMQNIVGVTTFLGKKIAQAGGDPQRETLTVIPTKDQKNYYTDDAGNCWRIYIFIEDTTTYQIIPNEQVFYRAAKAFGNFQNQLADYPASTLAETIPNFHNTAKRFEAFQKALDEDIMGRAAGIRPEIDFILQREKETHILVDLLAAGELPLRVTHNDTKLNNVLMDNTTEEGLCVIDLDTVMPGLAHYDFGDAIRFGASTAAEDETDLSKVEMSLSFFDAYTKGFLETAGDALTRKEKELLPIGAKLMTLECGMRFLTDYLVGDTYFKIHREGHNLDRTRTQLKLVADMEKKWTQMQQIVQKYI